MEPMRFRGVRNMPLRRCRPSPFEADSDMPMMLKKERFSVGITFFFIYPSARILKAKPVIGR